MSITIEHNAFEFSDWDGIFSGESVGDAFAKAGGSVEYWTSGQLVVTGLPYQDVMDIARGWNADYLGSVQVENPDPETLKMVKLHKSHSLTSCEI